MTTETSENSLSIQYCLDEIRKLVHQIMGLYGAHDLDEARPFIEILKKQFEEYATQNFSKKRRPTIIMKTEGETPTRDFKYNISENIIDLSDDDGSTPSLPPSLPLLSTASGQQIDGVENGVTPTSVSIENVTATSILNTLRDLIGTQNEEAIGSHDRKVRRKAPRLRRKYQCYECKRITLNYHALRRHMRVHPVTIRCERCFEEFPYLSGLKTHQFLKTKCQRWNPRGNDK